MLTESTVNLFSRPLVNLLVKSEEIMLAQPLVNILGDSPVNLLIKSLAKGVSNTMTSRSYVF